MELAFISTFVRDICEVDAIAKDQYGAEVAGKLQNRLADLIAATSVKDLIAGQPGEFNGNYKVELGNEFRLIFCANHVKNPYTETGTIDWVRVDRIQILAIERNG